MLLNIRLQTGCVRYAIYAVHDIVPCLGGVQLQVNVIKGLLKCLMVNIVLVLAATRLWNLSVQGKIIGL
jgi:hypothetical protein